MSNRIVSDAAVLRGKPRIRGTRISEDILVSYPHLTAEDVEEALRYAARGE